MAGSGEDLLWQKIPMVFPPTDEEAYRARKVVCANATDSGEATTLLKMLGLL